MLKRGQSLNINAIILIILGAIVLVVLIVGFTMGWQSLAFWIPNNNVDQIATQCVVACSTQSTYDFCSQERTLRIEDREYIQDCQILSAIGDVTGDFIIEDCPQIKCPSREVRRDPPTEDNPLEIGEIFIDEENGNVILFHTNEEGEFEITYNPAIKIKMNPGEKEIICINPKEDYAIEIKAQSGRKGLGVAYSYKKVDEGCSEIILETEQIFGNFFRITERFFSQIISFFSKDKIDLEEKMIFNAMIYARDQGTENFLGTEKKCYCGSNENCKDYARWIVKFSNEKEVDPLIITSLIIQESDCRSQVCSQSSCGLLQINLRLECENERRNLPSDTEECRLVLLNEPKRNIEIGVTILREKYNEFGQGVFNSWSYKNVESFRNTVDDCIEKYDKYAEYEGWDAALRGYNGWGCGGGADINFVENIAKIYQDLNTNMYL